MRTGKLKVKRIILQRSNSENIQQVELNSSMKEFKNKNVLVILETSTSSKTIHTPETKDGERQEQGQRAARWGDCHLCLEHHQPLGHPPVQQGPQLG